MTTTCGVVSRIIGIAETLLRSSYDGKHYRRGTVVSYTRVRERCIVAFYGHSSKWHTFLLVRNYKDVPLNIRVFVYILTGRCQGGIYKGRFN